MTALILAHWEFCILFCVLHCYVFQTVILHEKIGYEISAVGHGRHLKMNRTEEKGKRNFQNAYGEINLLHEIVIHNHKGSKATDFKQ